MGADTDLTTHPMANLLHRGAGEAQDAAVAGAQHSAPQHRQDWAGRTAHESRLHLAGYFPSITALACPDPIVKNSYLFYHYMLAKIYCTKSAPTIIIVQKTFAVARLVLLFIRHKAITTWLPTRLYNSGTQEDSRCSELNQNPKTFSSPSPGFSK